MNVCVRADREEVRPVRTHVLKSLAFEGLGPAPPRGTKHQRRQGRRTHAHAHTGAQVRCVQHGVVFPRGGNAGPFVHGSTWVQHRTGAHTRSTHTWCAASSGVMLPASTLLMSCSEAPSLLASWSDRDEPARWAVEHGHHIARARRLDLTPAARAVQRGRGATLHRVRRLEGVGSVHCGAIS